MGKLKSKRYLLAVVLAMGAFGAAFYIVFAQMTPVQWSREQPATAVGVAAQILPPDSMTLFKDEALTDELTAADILQFPVILLQPPLNLQGARFEDSTTVRVWLRNDSTVPLIPVEFSQPVDFRDTQTGRFLGGGGSAYFRTSVVRPSSRVKRSG